MWIATSHAILKGLVLAAGYQYDWFSKNAICSPVVPGRTLKSSGVNKYFEAPWWVPTQMKKEVFLQLCGGDQPTKLEWIAEGAESKLTVTQNKKVILNRRLLSSAEIFANRIRLWGRKGQGEEHSIVWKL